jgi:4-hydroxybenzoate polyprenyltransferase
MPRYTPEHLQGAIASVLNGNSIKKSAQQWGVPYATLCGRLTGSTSNTKAKKHFQRLTCEQESNLASWILIQGQLGFAPAHTQVREFATRILLSAGDTRPLGRKWMEGFLRRNPAVKTLTSKKIDYKRVKSVTVDAIQEFFSILTIPIVKQIPQSLRWNMDETGIAEGVQKDGLVVGCSGKPSIFVQSSEGRTWTSIVECVSADGRHLPPLVIFKGKTVQHQWFPEQIDDFKGWTFDATVNGWTSNDIGLQWLEKIFIPGTAEDAIKLKSKRLLVIDGHGSHVSDSFMWKCYCEGIYLACLPPHSSHITQPLDLSVFSPLKESYRKHLRTHNYIFNSAPIGKQNFLRCYSHARKEAFTSNTIISGWRATGLWPVNIAKPLKSRHMDHTRETHIRPLPWHIPLPQTPERSQDFSVKTPLKSGDLRRYESLLWSRRSMNGEDDDWDMVSRKLVFSKIGKRLDAANISIAALQQEVNSLQQQVSAVTRPKVAGKVKPTPNERFVNIKDIMKARMASQAAAAAKAAKLRKKELDKQKADEQSFQALCSEFQT